MIVQNLQLLLKKIVTLEMCKETFLLLRKLAFKYLSEIFFLVNEINKILQEKGCPENQKIWDILDYFV